MSDNEINENQFITLDRLKVHFKFTSTQHDNILVSIVTSANNELKKRIVTVVDNISDIEGSKFFGRCEDAALVFCEAEIRRQINHMHDQSVQIKKVFENMMASLLGDMRAIAPKRTSLEVVTRTIPFEDDYFAERHLP